MLRSILRSRQRAPARGSSSQCSHVVIVGGGFGGLYAAKSLRDAPARVTLIDRRNHHVFQPLLYQVATASLSPADIAYPIRAILRRQSNARVILANVDAIDLDARAVSYAGKRMTYDYLILAPGAESSYFGHDEWAEHAPGLKTLDDALEMRRRVFFAFEAAELEADEERRRALLTFVVIGGGPTGVELAGALGEIAHETLVRDFRSIDPSTSRICLIEAGERILASFPPELSRRAKRDLERLGVEVRCGAQVTGVEPDRVLLSSGEIATETILWAAGVSGSELLATLGAPLQRGGRVEVNPDLSLPAHPNVFVIGDAAYCLGPDGTPYPGLAPVAIQQGATAARNVVRALNGEPPAPFHYIDRGTMATIGKRRAVAVIRGRRLTGTIAWLAWVFVHILMLIGFRNRVFVMSQWMWSYVTRQRAARLITEERR
ncbi:MAG TPA: NAD(P)/FAD-dependent oxidoreductase [Thermomicrobiales bacterium]|nr:NAD(P)/FAD-dependent oxidoreductase [Thermomicrobiales bacterium]